MPKSSKQKTARHCIRRRLPWLLALLIIFAGATACQDENEREPGDPDFDTAAGNVHFASFLHYHAGQIYYSDQNDRIVSSQPDGTQPKVLGDGPAREFVADEQSLFFSSFNEQRALYKSDLDGTNRVRISHMQVKNLIVWQEDLFAIDLSTHQVVRLSKDGTRREAIDEATATSLIAADDLLYIAFADAEDGVIRYDPETGEKQRLLARTAGSLAVADGYLYFIDPAAENRLFSFSPGTDSSQALSEFGLDQPFIVAAGYLYAIDSDRQNRIYRWPLHGAETLTKEAAQLVVDDAAEAFVLCDNAVYYQRAGGNRLYRSAVSGGRPQRIR